MVPPIPVLSCCCSVVSSTEQWLKVIGKERGIWLWMIFVSMIFLCRTKTVPKSFPPWSETSWDMNTRTTIINTGKEKGRPAKNTVQIPIWIETIQISIWEECKWEICSLRELCRRLQSLWNTGLDWERLNTWSNGNSKTEQSYCAQGNWQIHWMPFMEEGVVALGLLLTQDCWGQSECKLRFF